jgi:hypothetical protein
LIPAEVAGRFEEAKHDKALRDARQDNVALKALVADGHILSSVLSSLP